MNTGTTGGAGRRMGRALRSAAVLLGLAAAAACMHNMGMEPPPAAEFGMGPRASAGGTYVAALEPAEPLRTGRMQRVRLTVRDAAGGAVETADIAVDGGMPQHGHGLPTRPRVTQALGGGAYQVDGLRFNMGGWWELRFRIASPAGTDSVTFNLDL